MSDSTGGEPQRLEPVSHDPFAAVLLPVEGDPFQMYVPPGVTGPQLQPVEGDPFAVQ